MIYKALIQEYEMACQDERAMTKVSEKQMTQVTSPHARRPPEDKEAIKVLIEVGDSRRWIAVQAK